ncbi:MAG: hypothetical protein KAT65_05655, partial [Methanophagales archaeon]|nr:hypothetical protein [Methanophagales archaeon]
NKRKYQTAKSKNIYKYGSCIHGISLLTFKLKYFAMSPNVSSIYDVATEGSNVPKGKGVARSVYAVLGDAL